MGDRLPPHIQRFMDHAFDAMAILAKGKEFARIDVYVEFVGGGRLRVSEDWHPDEWHDDEGDE